MTSLDGGQADAAPQPPTRQSNVPLSPPPQPLSPPPQPRLPRHLPGVLDHLFETTRRQPWFRLLAGEPWRATTVAVQLIVAGSIIWFTGGASSPYRWAVAVPIVTAAVLPGLALALGAASVAALIVLLPLLVTPGAPSLALPILLELAVSVSIAVLVRLVQWQADRARDALAERNDDLRAVHEAGRRLTLQTLNSDALCREVARTARELAQAASGLLVLTAPDRSRVLLTAWSSADEGERVVVAAEGPPGQSEEPHGLALETGIPVRIAPGERPPIALPSWYPHRDSYLAVPIVVDGERRGELVVAGKEGGRAFTQVCQLLLSVYATEASAALKSALLSEVVDEALEVASAERTRSGVVSERNEAVLDIARRLTETFDRRTILQTIVAELTRALDSDASTIRILEGDELRVVAWAGMSDAAAASMPVLRRDEGWFGTVVRTGQPWTCEDLTVDATHARSVARRNNQIEWRGDIAAPLVHGGTVIGVLSSVTRRPRQWSQEDVDFTMAVAAHASLAIHNAELFERTERLAREMRGLLEMSSELAGSLDPEQVAERIARHLVRALDVDGCRISYWDRTADRLLSLGREPRAAWRASIKSPALDDSMVRRVLQDQETGRIEVAGARSGAGASASNGLELTLLPLVAKGRSIGLVELLAGSHSLEGTRLELGRTMANEAAMALENARLYEEARNQADRDQLTGFFNHRYVHERLGEEIVRAQRSKAPLGLLMIDLDDFKLVNDTFGHLFGDRVLVWAAELIRSSLRASDVPARYGGDEFSIILPDADPEAARRAAARVVAAFQAHPFESAGRGPVPIGVSIGASSFPREARSAQQLIATADRALYRVKHDRGPRRAAIAGGSLPTDDRATGEQTEVIGAAETNAQTETNQRAEAAAGSTPAAGSTAPSGSSVPVAEPEPASAPMAPNPRSRGRHPAVDRSPAPMPVTAPD